LEFAYVDEDFEEGYVNDGDEAGEGYDKCETEDADIAGTLSAGVLSIKS
jgi:hypothetical protein